MATIPAYDAWMKSTNVLGLPRSANLKALDRGIKSGDQDKVKNDLRPVAF